MAEEFSFLAKKDNSNGKQEAPRPLFSQKLTLGEFVDELIETKLISLNQEYTPCEICMSDLIGRQNFIILNPCMHTFCTECIKGYSESLISEGNLSKLKCPSVQDSAKCDSNIREKDLIAVGVTQAMLDKFTKFSIESALNNMDDFGYCPQCQGHAELQIKLNLGQCQHCSFQYCTKCNSKYHPGKRCQNLNVDIESIKDFEGLENNFKDGFYLPNL